MLLKEFTNFKIALRLCSDFCFLQKSDTPAPRKIANSECDSALAPASSSTIYASSRDWRSPGLWFWLDFASD